jgi:hypothetical protein
MGRSPQIRARHVRASVVGPIFENVCYSLLACGASCPVCQLTEVDGLTVVASIADCYAYTIA